jgi:hypothetical protein
MFETTSIEKDDTSEPSLAFNNVVEIISEYSDEELQGALNIFQERISDNPELLNGVYFFTDGFSSYLAFPNIEYAKDRYELTVIKTFYKQELEFGRVVSRLDPKYGEEEKMLNWISQWEIPRLSQNSHPYIANLLLKDKTYKEIAKVASMRKDPLM